MKMTSIVSAASVLAASAVFAATSVPAASSVPVVDNVTIVQRGSKVVKINYDFTGDAGIVTLDIQTNSTAGWASIGINNFSNVTGEAFCVVKGTGKKQIEWRPKEAWPGHFADKGWIRAHLTAYATNTPPKWMAISLATNATARTRFYDREVPGGVNSRLYKTDVLLMRKIPAACAPWTMGLAATGDNKAHEVIFTQDYYMGIYEFTRGQLKTSGLTTNEYDAAAAVKPCSGLSHSDLRGWNYIYTYNNTGHRVLGSSYLGKLRTLTRVPLDLPSEAEWEFAGRAGRYGTPSDWSTIISQEAWTGTDGVTEPQEVGTKKANDFDMYDMLGNCWEWVLDYYGTNVLDPFYSSPAGRVDPHGPTALPNHLMMLHGESVGHTSDYYGSLWAAKQSNYQYYSTNTGFRPWAPGIVSWE